MGILSWLSPNMPPAQANSNNPRLWSILLQASIKPSVGRTVGVLQDSHSRMCSQLSFCWVAFCMSWTNNASFIPRVELWKKPRIGARPIWVWIQILPWTLGMKLHLSEPISSLENKLGPTDNLPYRPGGRIKWENSYGVPDKSHEMKWSSPLFPMDLCEEGVKDVFIHNTKGHKGTDGAQRASVEYLCVGPKLRWAKFSLALLFHL